MKPYRTLPRVVMAAVIVSVHAAGSESAPGFLADLTLEDGTQFLAGGDMTARYWPQPGDYLVQTENPDGTVYHYLNPKAVFEEKYEPSEESVS
jgi:type 1 glutamine amidotransferase